MFPTSRTLRHFLFLSSLVLVPDFALPQQEKTFDSVPIELKQKTISILDIPSSANFIDPQSCQDKQMVAEFFAPTDGSDSTGMRFGFTILRIGFDGHVLSRVTPNNFLDSTKIDTNRLGSLFTSTEGIFLLTQEAPKTDRSAAKRTVHELFGNAGDKFVIVRFRPDGRYDGIVKLELPFTPLQVGAFDSGSFLVAGTDPETRTPRVAIVAANGQLERLLDVHGDLSEIQFGKDNSREHGTVAEGASVYALLTSIVSLGNSALLVRELQSGPYFLISESGEVTKMELPRRKGFELFGIRASQNQIVIYFKKRVDDKIFATRTVILNSSTWQPIVEYQFNSDAYAASCSNGESVLLLRRRKDRLYETVQLSK